MGNKQSTPKTKKISLGFSSKHPAFINVHDSTSLHSQTTNDTPISTVNLQSFTPISTIQAISFPTFLPNNEPLPSEIAIASRTSFSTRNRLSIICANHTDNPTNINNGVTGKYLSFRIAKIAVDFWNKNVQTLSVADKLELGAAIFFAMLSTNEEMKEIIQSNLKKDTNLKSTSQKYFEMIDWLTRHLLRNDIDLYSKITQLGMIHQSMGINIKHFNPFLEAIHENLGYYFPNKYTIQVKYAWDEIFQIAAQIMTTQNIKCCSYLNDIANTFNTNNIEFLKSLDICLKSSVGKRYLFRYLTQCWCEELSIFLQTLHKFKHEKNAKSRFMVARNINKTSIQSASNLAINISYDCRKNLLTQMNKLEQRFMARQELIISSDFYEICEVEVKKLIRDNHWSNFVNKIRKLQLHSLE